MKDDPQLIDIFAMFAMNAQVNNPLKPQDDESRRLIAERSYAMANAMITERKNWIGKNND